MRDSFHDLETYSPTPIQGGTHRYAEKAEVLLWPYALEDDIVKVWDRTSNSVHWADDLSGLWAEAPTKGMPVDLEMMLRDPETLVWFQNGGHFDFVVLKHAMPKAHGMIAEERRRDTMVQAFAHALPGSLDRLGTVLNLAEDQRKITDGKRLVQLFCKPQGEDFIRKHGTDRATRQTHPAEWLRFVQYAGGDITTMRAARRLMPQWNYKDKQVALWHLDCKINNRGFAVDVELAEAAVRASDKEKAELARQTRQATDGAVGSATQRDELLAHILAEYNVDLPDMQSDTLERRLDDPNLPEAVKDLLRIRLQASRNSAAKFKRLLKGVSSDGRLRGCAQFRGAGRTGRWAHRMFQPGNMMRPTMSQELIDLGIASLKTDCADLIFPDVMEMIGNTVRGAIIAPPGRKLVIADLSNIEGRVAAWLAGEEWKLQAFRDFDTIVGHDEVKDKPIRKGFDLYIKSYASSFNMPPESVPEKGSERQIGKVCLAKGSLVLTDSGWTPIERVTPEQKLWDGVEWVQHMGLLSQGVKPVISLGALWLTPDHSVLCGTQWKEACALQAESTYLSQALVSGAAHLPSLAISSALWAGLQRFSCVAIAGALSTAYSRTISAAVEVAGALTAAATQSLKSVGGSTLTRCLRPSTGSVFCSVLQQPASGALPRPTPGGRTTEAAGSGCATSGSPTGLHFSRTFARCRGGMTRAWRWIAKTLTGTTNQATSSSSPSGRTSSTDAGSRNSRPNSTVSEKRMPTFDLACAGPRKRFTVLSARGPLIVHNCELMFQYGGGVGAWITGAATYGIDLDKMTEQVWDVLPGWAKDEAQSFLEWLYEKPRKRAAERVEAGHTDAFIRAQLNEACLKARFGLTERTFVACDAIKRLWRSAHPRISSYWKELEETVRTAMEMPGTTFPCRKVKIRCDGAWLRIGLPSGRALCYPKPRIEKGDITYVGQDTYTRKWGPVKTYGGKLFENITQAVACDQLAECMPQVEEHKFDIVMHVHDELICEAEDRDLWNAPRLAALMCSDLGWNDGLPLAAAGFETDRYRKD